MVGIWGLGGGGKTTLASSLYDEIKTMFDGSCCVKDIREESNKKGLEELQKDILSLVLKQKKEKLVGDVGSLIESRLRRKKVLIVLDDVNHLEQLEALAGSHDWFGEGSRIIITTRDEHVLRAHKVKIVIYNISLLNDDEAIQLFYKHTVEHVRTIENHEKLSKDVVSYAGGLPLALKVLGSFLCDKKEREWKSALARLKDIPESDIVERLKISYDGLKSEEKELFLDIACFFRGEFKDSAMVILDACGFHPIIGVEVLIQKALITVSQDGWIEMHDLIEEMGHYIVREENPKNPEKHSRIWLKKDIRNICAMDSMMENFEIEALYYPLEVKIPLDNLPEVLANMKKLRLISLVGYAATSLPREFQPTKLCYLGLERSLVEQLWEGYKVLSLSNTFLMKFRQGMVSMKQLFGFSTSLRRLNLCWCKLEDGDISSVVFHELSNLQVLDLRCNNFSRLHSSLSRLPRLKLLNLSHCYKLVELPDLPSSIAILKAYQCDSLEIVDLPTNHLKWLWKVSLTTKSRRVDGKRVVESMLQGNAVQDYFISLYLYNSNISTRDFGRKTCMLELPSNWCNEFSGFLIYATKCGEDPSDFIFIEDAVGWENEDDVLEVSDDEIWGSNTVHGMCYISFASLMHTTWLNSPHTKISFHIFSFVLKVELVPRRSKGDSIERPKDATKSSEFWDEQHKDKKTFEIKHDSKSSISIGWCMY